MKPSKYGKGTLKYYRNMPKVVDFPTFAGTLGGTMSNLGGYVTSAVVDGADGSLTTEVDGYAIEDNAAYVWSYGRPIYLAYQLKMDSVDATCKHYMGLGTHTGTSVRFGIEVRSGSCYGYSSDGSTLSDVDLNTVVALNTLYTFEAIFDPDGGYILFFINGELKGTKSTNLPTGGTSITPLNYLVDNDCGSTVTSTLYMMRLGMDKSW